MPEHATCSTGPLFESPVFKRNTEALSLRQPELADQLHNLVPPSDARIVDGRDGNAVMRLSTSEQEIVWLGGSSMPSVSAPILLSDAANLTGNIAISSVGSGYEAMYLARYIPLHCAVFVCERDLSSVGLMLALVDVSEALRQGRIVFICGGLEDRLLSFLREHTGYGFPSRLLPLEKPGTLSLVEMAAALNRAGARVEALQAELLAELSTDVGGFRGDLGNESPTVLILSVDATKGAMEQAALIQSACTTLGWRSWQCIPDVPEHCGFLARLSMLRESRPDLIIHVNSAPGRLHGVVPESIEQVCWYSDTAMLAGVNTEGLSECKTVLAATEKIRELLIDEGARPESVSLVETAVERSVFRPLADDCRDEQYRCELAVLSDGEDVSCDACNIRLESHERLWSSLIGLIDDAARSGDRLSIEELLPVAERRAAAKLGDQVLRDEFQKLANSRLVKTIVARRAVQDLQTLGHVVGLWGTSWHRHSSVSRAHRGPIPGIVGRNIVYNAARVVVIPFIDQYAGQYVREALAAGCCPLIRGPRSEFFSQYPESGAIMESVLTFSNSTQLLESAHRLVTDDSFRDSVLVPLRRDILADHTLDKSLTRIRSLLLGECCRGVSQ